MCAADEFHSFPCALCVLCGFIFFFLLMVLHVQSPSLGIASGDTRDLTTHPIYFFQTSEFLTMPAPLKILLASRNAGKLREFSELLPDLEFVLWPAEAPELPETGAFFQDNALQKADGARTWWLEHGTEPVDGVLADDSGLCVDALWGGPGVLSARFALDLSTYQDRNHRLLAMLPEGAGRTARFVCVLAFTPMPGRLHGEPC